MAAKQEAPVNITVATVIMDDGTVHRVHPFRPSATLAYRHQFGDEAFDTESGEPKDPMHALYWLSWHAMTRPDGDMETWLDKVADITPNQEPVKTKS